MASPFWSALGRLDTSVKTIQSQVDRLRAALEVDDAELSRGLTEAHRDAALLRDLIFAERADAHWTDRAELDLLIHDLEVAAQEKRNQQRRAKLAELAGELEAGKIKHRFESRAAALNALRMEAVKELRREAAVTQQEKELPGPDAGDWLHWACNLQEGPDTPVLASLHRDFPAVERFIGEMEESYWIPGERAQPPAEFAKTGKGPMSTAIVSPDRPGVSA